MVFVCVLLQSENGLEKQNIHHQQQAMALNRMYLCLNSICSGLGLSLGCIVPWFTMLESLRILLTERRSVKCRATWLPNKKPPFKTPTQPTLTSPSVNYLALDRYKRIRYGIICIHYGAYIASVHMLYTAMCTLQRTQNLESETSQQPEDPQKKQENVSFIWKIS